MKIDFATSYLKDVDPVCELLDADRATTPERHFAQLQPQGGPGYFSATSSTKGMATDDTLDTVLPSEGIS